MISFSFFGSISQYLRMIEISLDDASLERLRNMLCSWHFMGWRGYDAGPEKQN